MVYPKCYIVNKNIDGYLASKFGWKAEMGSKGLNPMKIASLRGLYDQAAEENKTAELLPDNPTQADLDEAFEKLKKFRAGIREVHRAKMSKGTRRIDRAYDALRHAYSLHERKSRISLLSNLFSSEVDRLMEGGKADRQSFVNGFAASDGKYYGGEFSILEGVYNNIHQIRANYYRHMRNPEEGFKAYQKNKKLDFQGAPTNAQEFKEMCEHRFNEYTKILENWNELVPFVLKDLVKKEGVKLGIKTEYAAVASSDNFGDNDIAAKWDLSESKRDGWQENSDLQSAFGSVGQQVRRILATVPQIESIPQYVEKTDGLGNKVTVYAGLKQVPVVDDLGNPQFMDATKTHQALMEYLKGVQDSEDMMRRLCRDGELGKGVAKIPWMQPIVDVLMSNPQARTQFFCDFKKNFQPYSIMWEEESENSFIKKWKTKILNKPANMLKGKYEMLMSSKGNFPINVKMWGYTPVFDEVTKEINWQRLAELRKTVLAWTHEEIAPVENEQAGDIRTQQPRYASSTAAPLINTGTNTFITINGKSQRVTADLRRDFLTEVFTSLGYDVTMDAIDSIIHSRDIYTVREQLEQLFNPDNQYTGFLYAAGVQTLGDTNVRKLQEKHMKFRSLYSTSKGENGQPVKEHSEKLLDIISKHQEGYRVESRARYQGNTMYSFVAPSYLGDRLETIQNFVEADNKEGLLQFLKEEYLNSPFFVDDEYLSTEGKSGKILNTWLADIVEACKDNKTPLQESVAAIFNYERDLGREDKKFEDFTAREHGVDMLIHFFADEQQKKGYGGKGTRDINKKLSAMYPVFILGDAGVSKYIRAPRISSAVRVNKEGNVLDEADAKYTARIEYRFDDAAQDRVLEGLYNIYMQERRRMAIDEAMAYKMYANGKEVKHPKGEFSILTFLNPDSQEYKEEYAISEDKKDDKDTVKAAIRKYMDDATKTFKDRLDTLGVLETASQGKNQVYKNINSIATPENIDTKIQEFFWNTKLATAQQLQLMTIDPSFYHGTKDLQKRYKEIHAPGNVLDLMARDFDGNLYSPDGIERVVYFRDLSINAEQFNPEFMAVVLRTFAQEGKEKEVEEAIKDGIIQPKSGAEETARQNRLADLLGNNYGIYRSYTGNTLTDGQGYRTLTSYRRVKGMAGQWTEQMENAYKAIMQIRKNHEVRDASGKVVDYTEATPEELKQIASFALVLQPIKPYLFTHEKYPIEIAKKDKNGNVVKGADGKPVMIKTYKYIPVQHKYAEALIIPELMPKGHKLRDLGFWMDKHNIDMVGSDKIAKVGCFGQADLSNIGNKTNLETAMGAGYIHELPYKDYRIQTNVPEHINASQLFGTQVRKLIMSGLDMDGAAQFYADLLGIDRVNLSTSKDGNDNNANASLNGRNLLALYNSLICANIFDSYDKFAKNAGDIQELANLLQQSTVGSMREAMDNLFSYVVTGSEADLQKFMIPLFEGGLEHDSAALILSTFKKIVNKQQISGGSAVQVSAFGINGYDEDGGLRFVTDQDNNKNILYAEIEMPFDKSFMVDVRNADGSVTKQPVSLDYDKYCNMDGTLIPTGEALKKGTKEWKKYQSYTYKKVDGKLIPCRHDDPQAEVYKPLIEAEYPDILSILAYRIPTERDYSMINCQIKRFTSKVAGGTIKVPPQGTTIAGFDFDIDKLYFMQREYHKHYKNEAYVESNFSESDVYAVWNAIYQNNPEISAALDNAQSEAMTRDPENHTRTLKSGRILPKNPKHSYWEDAKIEEKFGKKKGELFADAAKQIGVKPVTKDNSETVEWLEEYDFNKAPEENTRAARNNLLITLIQARLMDPQTVKQRYTPGGFDNASKAARMMRELFHGDLEHVKAAIQNDTLDTVANGRKDPEPNYDPTDPYTILIYNQQNQVAGKLIGIFANQNTNHAFASAMDEFELYEPISFAGHSFRDLLHKNSEDAAQIDLNMAEFLAASVDAVKDPVLNFLNLNTITADAGALLARIGYNTKEIGLLFNQPIIRKICVDSFNNGSNINSVIDDAKKMLLGYLTGINVHNKVNIGINDLALGIVNEREMLENGKTQDDFFKDNARMQYAVLELFSNILKASSDVSDFILNTKFTASNAVSSSFGGMYAQQMRVSTYVDKFPKTEKDKGFLSYKVTVVKGAQQVGLMSKPIDNSDGLILQPGEKISDYKKRYLHYVRFNPFAYEQAMYDANRNAIKLLSRYYPYETKMYTEVRDRMNRLSWFGTLSEDDINDIHSNIPVALLARQEHSDFNGEAEHIKEDGTRTGMTNRDYYRNKFAEDLMGMLAADPDVLGKLEIFKYLSPESVEVATKDENGLEIKTEAWRIQMQDIGGMDADVKEAIRESWAYLMEVQDDGYFDNQDYAELGRDLFMYCFYQLGFDFSPLSFMHLAPTAVKDNIIVQRSNSLPLKDWSADGGNILPDTDDVLVWSANVPGSFEKASEFGADRSVIGRISGDAYQLPEKLDQYADIQDLIHEAKSHPELKFKIDRDLTREEFQMFVDLKEDVPANIYFSSQTLENAGDLKSKLSYGKSRTYRQFLYEILDETGSQLNVEEFAQMFILNHLDNARYVLDISKSNKRLREIVKEQAGQLKDGFKFKDRITIDISKYTNDQDAESLKNLVKVKMQDNTITQIEWRPCIVIDGSYYMAESNTDLGFNITGKGTAKISYRKVVPWGSSKTIRYDGNEELKPTMRYQASMNAIPQIAPIVKQPQAPVQQAPSTPEAPQDNVPTGDNGAPEPVVEQSNGSATGIDAMRQLAEDYIFKEMVNAIEAKFGPMLAEDKQGMRDTLSKSSMQDLNDTVATIRKACRENGVMMLDDNGNPMMGC